MGAWLQRALPPRPTHLPAHGLIRNLAPLGSQARPGSRIGWRNVLDSLSPSVGTSTEIPVSFDIEIGHAVLEPRCENKS